MPKKNQGSLGKALQHQQQKKIKQSIAKVSQPGQFYHDSAQVQEEYQIQQKNLQSIIDQNPLNEYLQIAELANQKFVAEKKGEIVVEQTQQSQPQKQIIINVNQLKLSQMESNNIYDYKRNELMTNLRIPRRPIWNQQTTINELREMENEAFLRWRKDLAKFEEENYMITLTPYEKNLEVWKQLWRVVEKSDILVQVVDGRDPLFYRCVDLEKYVNEQQNRIYRPNQTKLNFLLINKSDLLSAEVRQAWSKYLNEINVNHMFFSAIIEQKKIDNDDTVDEICLNQDQQFEESKTNLEFINTSEIANRTSLLSELKKLVHRIRDERKPLNVAVQQQLDHEEQLHDENLVVVGMVGYPNVGKSSVINTLCNRKLVGVGSRPGKTKHFQTIELEKSFMLCDCPGLIFPNAASSRAEMVCNGVLPIDNIKDYLSPIDLLVQRIPKIVFEKLYGLVLEKQESSTLLIAYSQKRGFFTGSGVPDQAKASKIILKDLTSGKLLFCKLPENCQVWNTNKLENIEQIQEQKEQKKADKNVDEEFENQLIQEQKITNEEILSLFTEDDFFQLMEGKKVKGIKISKQQRREIKFAYQRGFICLCLSLYR